MASGWFDDLLNTQWFKDGAPLPRRQIVDVTFPQVSGSSNDGDIVDDGPTLDQHRLRMPSYRPAWSFPLTTAPAIAALRYVRPFRDTYDTTAIVNQAYVVPKPFIPYYLGWVCFGTALADAITFTMYKNGVATALSLTIPGGTSGATNDIFQANGTNVRWDRGDTLGLGVTQFGATAQASWHALVTLQ
jgi:hypothetical protein